MSFDPDVEPATQDQVDAYIQWCAAQLVAAADEGPGETPRIYATAMQAASWLWVIAQARLHLHDAVVEHRENHQRNLAALFTRARQVERAKGDIDFSQLLAARVALDCFAPIGRYAPALLEAAKMAVDALTLIFVYPPVDKWSMHCPGSWSLVLCGTVLLEEINEHEMPLTYEDYSVAPAPEMTGKIVWDAANRAAQIVGAPPPSPN